MKVIELESREFHRRTRWAVATARRGVAVAITAPGQPAVTLALGRPKKDQGGGHARMDWESHSDWLKTEPKLECNPVDELRAQERRCSLSRRY